MRIRRQVSESNRNKRNVHFHSFHCYLQNKIKHHAGNLISRNQLVNAYQNFYGLNTVCLYTVRRTLLKI